MAFNPTSISLDLALKNMAPQAMILTRNNRQSRFLEMRWAELSDDIAIANPPTIIPIQAWLHTIWDAIEANPTIQNNAALCLMINQLSTSDTPDALDTDALAQSVCQALGLLDQYQLTLDDLALYADDQNTALLLANAKKFTDSLASLQQNSVPAMANHLAQVLNKAESPAITQQLTKSIYLYGFVDINPSLEYLLTALSQHCTIQNIEPKQITPTTTTHLYKKPQFELESMAQWAMGYHQQHPEKAILCVVPDLAQSYTACLDAFLQADAKALDYINISSGEALNQTLVGQTALSFLNLNPYHTGLKDLLQCIRIPLWLEDNLETQMEKDRLANQLYQADMPSQSLKKWLAQLQPSNTIQEKLLTYLQQWGELKFNKPKGKQTFQTWLQYFCNQWHAIGWPGKQALSSLHYQQYQHFQNVWQSYLELDAYLKPCSHDQALHYFNLLCKQSLFAPESKNRPIQVLGALEAHGLQADALWFCHLDAQTWPPTVKPNTLLPFSLQKQYKMPNACPLFTKNYYATITNDIVHSATEIILSYAQWQEHLEQSPSPFFQNEKFIEQEQSLAEQSSDQPSWFQTIEDLTGPTLSGNKIPGGSYGIQSQAQCPFQYFAHYRLNLSEQTEPSIGFEAFERGSIVHEALAYFYQQLGKQNIQTIDQQQKQQLIENAIMHSLKDMHGHQLFIDTEKDRLTLLLNQWLDFEYKRPKFQIESIEATTQFSIHDFTLTMRLDRVDRLDDNSLLIIDYKTSQQASTQGWYDDRLTNPQIPLYVLALGDTCQSAALALVKRGDPKFVGLSQKQTDIKGIRATEKDDETWQWPALKNHWHEKINNLTFEINTGYAAVMPDSESKPCQYCDMYLVCRVHHD